MPLSTVFRRMFQGAALEAEDLLLLEPFQVAYLPGWAPERELAAVLWAYPLVERTLSLRHPPIRPYFERVKAQSGPAAGPEELAACAGELVWTIADLLVYNKCPEVYDALEFHNWDFREVTSVVALEGKIVVDGGSGTGRVALAAAGPARTVFAVEPVGRLRQFIRDRAARAGLANLFVLDGMLHAVPLPAGTADVFLTSHALGWYLDEELAEMQRVVKPGGWIVHCPGTAESPGDEPLHQQLLTAGYRFARYEEADGTKRKYYKQV